MATSWHVNACVLSNDMYKNFREAYPDGADVRRVAWPDPTTLRPAAQGVRRMHGLNHGAWLELASPLCFHETK